MTIKNKILSQSIIDQAIKTKDQGRKDIKSFNMNFGPQHPAAHGVLRMIIQLCGETIEKADIHIGLLHRGTEKLIETKNYLLGLPYFDRLDYCSMLVQEHGFCLGLEALNNKVNNNLYNLNIRTLFDELTRILNHLLAVSCHSLDVGSMSSIFWAFEEREHIMEFYERLSGARMHAAFYRPFEFNSEGILSKQFLQDILLFSKNTIVTLNEIHNILTYNKIWKQRLISIGALSIREVKNYNLSGILARSTGVKEDLRIKLYETYGSYYSLNFNTFLGVNGDCFDRYLIRMCEMVESLNIINQLIGNKLLLFNKNKVERSSLLLEKDKLNFFINNISANYKPIDNINDKKYDNIEILKKKENVTININRFLIKKNKNYNSYSFLKMVNVLEHFREWTIGIVNLKKNIKYRSLESPKGEFGVTLVGNTSNKPYRCKIKSPSFNNLKLLSRLAKGHLLADLVTLIGTIDIVFGEIDR